MKAVTQIRVPSLVRIKPGALARLGIYLARENYRRALVLTSPLPEAVAAIWRTALNSEGIDVAHWETVDGNSFENAVRIFGELPPKTACVVGIGGGKALDIAKYVAFLARLPYLAAPTSLSNDGFCSPQSSLTMAGKRRSLPAGLPDAVIIDVDICLNAPKALWLSGVGDLSAKLTAVADWKLAFHHRGEPVNDLAALLSDASVLQFLAAPEFSPKGMALLGTALMLNGIAMEISGSSRPASGGEHLISHALDATSKRPRLHGLQVGVAAYLVSRLQGGENSAAIQRLFQETGFWDEIKKDPFSKAEWLEAVRLAPSLKEDFFTVLSLRDCLPEVAAMLQEDPILRACFV